MTFYTTTTCDATRVNFPSDYARDAVYAEFGGRHARALDQDNFVDVAPNWQRVGRVAEAITKTLDRHRRSAERLFPASQPTHLKLQGTDQ